MFSLTRVDLQPPAGLILSPTHVLEPEVPVENVVAYIEAVRDGYKWARPCPVLRSQATR